MTAIDERDLYESISVSEEDFARVAQAISFMTSKNEAFPSLEALSSEVGLSPFHFQRMFTRLAGVSPKEFQQAMTLLRAKPLLQAQNSLLDTAVEIGLSGPSRLHDLFLSVEKMTPGEYKAGGAKIELAWSISVTPLGEALFVVAPKGLCHLSFLRRPEERTLALEQVQKEWPLATWQYAPDAIEPYASEVVRRLTGLKPESRLGLLLRGTELRIKVWMALLAIPAGKIYAYQDIAKAVGSPQAVRAVASCIAANPIAVLVPCHRVIRASGCIGEYRWGSARKAVLLARERL